jgi:uncharacterized protein YyaL (SSP411 family)
VDLLLRRMSQGGIYDHLGGGYARYSVDAIWLVPHFEKMLYDNAQILELLASPTRAARPAFAQRADETVGWLLREMVAARTAPPSPPASTPTARARKASSTSGRPPRWTRCSARTARCSARPTTWTRRATGKATSS